MAPLNQTIYMAANQAILPLDLNNDGKMELAAFNTTSTTGVTQSGTYSYNVATGTFIPYTTLSASIFADNKNNMPLLGDLNGDSKSDFLGLFYDRTQGSPPWRGTLFRD